MRRVPPAAIESPAGAEAGAGAPRTGGNAHARLSLAVALVCLASSAGILRAAEEGTAVASEAAASGLADPPPVAHAPEAGAAVPEAGAAVPEAGEAVPEAGADDAFILRRGDGNAPIPGAARRGLEAGRREAGTKVRAPGDPARPAGGLRSLATGGACLGLVLLGIVALAWVFKRFAPRAAAAFKSPCLEVLGRTFLDRGRSVYLLRVGERVLVVGCSAAGLERLAEIDDPEEAADLCRQARATGGAGRSGRGMLGRNPLGLLGGRRSFLRSLHEAAGDPRAGAGDSRMGAGGGTESERREPGLETARVQAPEELAVAPVSGTATSASGGGFAALQDEAARLRQQLETMRRTL